MISRQRQYLQQLAARALLASPEEVGPQPLSKQPLDVQLFHTPSSFSRHDQLRNVTFPETLPDHLILEFGPELDEFSFAIAGIENQELNIVELFDEILMYLMDNRVADESIAALHDDVRNIHYNSEYDSTRDAEVVASAAADLARQILIKLRFWHLYVDNFFPYIRNIWIDPKTIMLQKYIPK